MAWRPTLYNPGMDADPTGEPLVGRAVAAAVETCRQRRSVDVLADPLGFPEFDIAAWRQCTDGMPVEVEAYTRPKQGGGTRVEVVPDFATSVALQVAADRLGGEPVRAYASWWETVPMWIRHALVEGMAVIVADVEDYFGSLPGSGIARALRSLDLDDGTVETTLGAIRKINAVPDAGGASRSGLPVSQDDLLWRVADAALSPVDETLAREPMVARHVRWVDDFFIAAPPGDVDQVLRVLRTALAAEGMRLNSSKTRVLDSLADYERQTMTREHRLITSLRMASSRSPLSGSQGRALDALAESDRLETPEQARLWKRAYALASRLRSFAFVPAAIEDLERYPTATEQIASYLRLLNWPCDTAVQAVQVIERALSDSQAIVLLRALLGTGHWLPAPALAALKALSASASVRMHPYAQALLHACLVFRQRHRDGTVVKRLLSFAGQCGSPFARRTVIELLWQISDERCHLAELARRDGSPTVRGLTMLPAIAGPTARGRTGDLHEGTPATGAWSDVGAALRSAWLQAA